MEINLEIDASDLMGALERLVPALDSALHDAMLNATQEVTDEAKRNAPVGEGTLRDSIVRMPVEGSFSAGTLTGGVTATAPHAFAIEEGARPHEIRPKDRRTVGKSDAQYKPWLTKKSRRRLRFPAMGGAGGWAFAKVINHPGNAAKPFMAPAWEAKKNRVIDEFRAAVRRAINAAGKG